MNSKLTLVGAVLVGIVIGYFLGREHVRYELRSALSAGFAEAFGTSGRADSGAASETKRILPDTADESPPRADDVAARYIADDLELYDLSAKYIKTYSGRVPGVLFKLKNSGEATLDRVEVTVYFKDASGNVIAEEDFHPVIVTKYSVSDSKPLRPGYIWQMEAGKYYTAKNVPTEWQEGAIEAAITDIRIAE